MRVSVRTRKSVQEIRKLQWARLPCVCECVCGCIIHVVDLTTDILSGVRESEKGLVCACVCSCVILFG